MAISLNRKLKSALLEKYYEDLEKIDQKIYWYDKLKKWEMSGYCDGCSPVHHFRVDLPEIWSEADINIFIKKDYPFIKAVHLILDDLVDYMGVDPEILYQYDGYSSIYFRHRQLVTIGMHSLGECRALYKEVNKVERKIVGYECG